MGEAATPSVAAIDCGTNTIKLLIAAVTEDGLVERCREARMVRLGEAVDRTGSLSQAGLARTYAAVEEYADLIASHEVTRIRFCATSATRDAANAGVFSQGVQDRLGVRPEVLDGTEEAALSFAGAVGHLRTEPSGEVLVIDIGGGSTELILGRGAEVRASDSMDVGSVRLHERHLGADPPTAAQIAACVADIDAALDACPVSAAGAGTVVGVAGTVTTVAAAVLDLPAYDRDRIDQQVIALAEVHRVAEDLLAQTVAERRARPYLHPGRADVIGAGSLILSRVLRRVGTSTMVVSEADILDGIALSLAG